MAYLFLSAVAMSMLLVGFEYSYCLPGIENAYLGLYKGIMERCVLLLSPEGYEYSTPRFSLNEVRKELDPYFRVHLKPYCREYSFKVASLEQPTIGDLTMAIKVSFSARINDLSTINKEATFRIWRTDNG